MVWSRREQTHTHYSGSPSNVPIQLVMVVRLNQMKSNMLLDCEGQFFHISYVQPLITQSTNQSLVSFRLNNKQSAQYRTSTTKRRTTPSNQPSERAAVKSGLWRCKWKVSVPVPLTVRVASCCVDSLLTCDPRGDGRVPTEDSSDGEPVQLHQARCHNNQWPSLSTPLALPSSTSSLSVAPHQLFPLLHPPTFLMAAHFFFFNSWGEQTISCTNLILLLVFIT